MQVLNDDAQIDVLVDGTGESIVMLHGFPLTREIWDVQAAALARDHRVVRLDLRGMGASAAVGGPYLMATLASDVAAVIDAIGAPRVTLVGHSLGGYVALAFARMYAERVERLALVCSRITADDAARAAWRFSRADAVEAANSGTAIIEEMLPAMLSKESVARNPGLADRVRAIAAKNDPRGLAAMLRGMALRESSEDIATDLSMPVLIVAGRHDTIPAEEVQAMAAAFPRARLIWAEHSAHLPMLEEPQMLCRVLAAFVSGE
jgi:3-oxoadipate enol-lactonase